MIRTFARRGVLSGMMIAIAVLIAMAPTIAAHAPAPAARGLAYGYRMTSSADVGGKSVPGAAVIARGQVVNGVARLDFDSLANRPIPMAEPGGYMFMGAASDKLTIVVPSRREYIEINLADFVKFTVGGMMAGANGPKIRISDVKVTSQRVGAGGMVAGHRTQRYRITQAYTVTVNAVTQSRSRTTRTTTDYWVATGLAGFLNPYTEVEQAMTSAALRSLDGGADLVTRTSAARKKLFSGVPVKIVSRTEDSADDMPATSRVATSELTSITRTNIVPAVMLPPADYLKREFPPRS